MRRRSAGPLSPGKVKDRKDFDRLTVRRENPEGPWKATVRRCGRSAPGAPVPLGGYRKVRGVEPVREKRLPQEELPSAPAVGRRWSRKRLFRIGPLRGFRRLLERRSRAISQSDIRARALVFAPHPDDETLGCGGALALKRKAGAELLLAVVTDGSRSHSRLMPPPRLAEQRRKEVLEAAGELGIPAEAVTFFDFREELLRDRKEELAEKTLKTLEEFRPGQIFIPYRRDRHPDHEIVNRAVLDAIERWARPLEVLEYPVWAWGGWPWIGLPVGLSRDTLFALFDSAARAFGLSLLRNLNRAVDIEEVLPLKRAALARHRSQVERLVDDPRWAILPEVAEGDFLECFFGRFEFFRSYVFPQAQKAENGERLGLASPVAKLCLA